MWFLWGILICPPTLRWNVSHPREGAPLTSLYGQRLMGSPMCGVGNILYKGPSRAILPLIKPSPALILCMQAVPSYLGFYRSLYCWGESLTMHWCWSSCFWWDSPQTNWRLSRYWISNPEVDSGLRQQMTMYWSLNPDCLVAVVWDAFKAFCRGQCQSLIGGVRKQMRADLAKAEGVTFV